MKLWAIFRFELAYQLRRVWPWLIFATLAVFSFLVQRDNSLAEALYQDFFVNSPFAIAKTTVAGGLIWLLLGATVAGEAGARDVGTRMYPLVFTTPIRKLDYLGGRLLAALVVNAVLLAGVQVGILLAIYAPGMDAKVVGPFRPAAYLTAYGFIALPNAIAATALQFSFATRTGRATAAYLGSLVLFFTSFFIASFLLFRRGIGTLLDPIGMRFVLDDLSHQWTTVEKNERLLRLDGAILTNRLFWLGVAAAVFALTYARFRFAHRAEGGGAWWRRTRRSHPESPTATRLGVSAAERIAVPDAPRAFGFAFDVRQTMTIAADSFRAIVTSWAGAGALLIIALLSIPIVLDQMTSSGVPLVPATIFVLNELTAPLSAELSRWVIVPLLIVFFAGELIWRERDAGMGEIADAMPGSEWAPLVGKFLGLSLVVTTLMALLMAAGMVAQAVLGYRAFEVGLYLKVLFGLQLPDYLLFALLACVVHVVVNHKYVGHLAAVLTYVFIALASLFGVEHNLLIYGGGPAWSYTDMRGFGASIAPWLWFKLYWTAWAVLLAVVARLFWVRGRESAIATRLGWARRRFRGPTAWTAALSTAAAALLGGFIFYNTNVRNEYLSAGQAASRRAEYERRYAGYAKAPQPQLTNATLRVEIHPERRVADFRGTYRLVNRGETAIDTIQVATSLDAETSDLTFDRPAVRAVDDRPLGYRMYVLGTALEPGDSVRVEFQVRVRPHGFRESSSDMPVVANGAYLTSAFLPAIGYQKSRELITPTDRREHGLPARPVIPSLYDVEARTRRNAGVIVSAIVGTDADQIGVAPGALRRSWREGGRRYFEYATDAPIGADWAFLSARYAVRDDRWSDSTSGKVVAIRILHDPAHAAQVDRMLESIRGALAYYGERFGPYEYDHLTFVEQPGNGVGLHAEPSFVTYSGGFALWHPSDRPGSLDLPFAVVGHEMAHEWTVPYASVEGAPVMSESVAWYYAMQLVKHVKGARQLERLRSFMREPYPYAPIRRGEPLLRGLDPYLSYRKGPFALYALSEYVGADRVDGALRRLLETHRSEDAPLATTLDLYRELRAVTPDSLQDLVHDLFEVNTFWELATERATVERLAPASWRVTLDVRARKVVVDSAGVEREVSMNDLVEVGVFAAPVPGERRGAPLYLGRQRLLDGQQTIVVLVDKPPALAGVDPNYLLVDLDTGDNTRELTAGSGKD
jgi:hypothetical protein